MNYVNVAMDYVMAHFERTDMITFAVIAILFALALPAFGMVFVMALIAVIVHHIVIFAIPIVQAGGDFSVFDYAPLTTANFWMETGVLFVGYVVAMLILHALKRLFFRGGD